MQSKYHVFDRSRLRIKPISERNHDMHLDFLLGANDAPQPYDHPDLPVLADRLVSAGEKRAARV